MPRVEIFGDDFLGGAEEILGDDDDDLDVLGDDDDDGADLADLFGAAKLMKFAAKGAGGGRLVAGNRKQLMKAKQLVKFARQGAADKLAGMKLAQSGGVIRNRAYSQLRKLPAGFQSSIAVPAGDAVTITVRAVVPIRPDRLMISTTCAPYFELTSLTVALDNHMLTPEGVPCELFTPNATGVNEEGTGFFKIPTIDVGTEINMVFVNIDGASHFLRGAWICTAAV